MNLPLRAILPCAALAIVWSAVWAEDIKSGVTERIGGPFQLKAFTGDNKGKQLCYV